MITLGFCIHQDNILAFRLVNSMLPFSYQKDSCLLESLIKVFQTICCTSGVNISNMNPNVDASIFSNSYSTQTPKQNLNKMCLAFYDISENPVLWESLLIIKNC